MDFDKYKNHMPYPEKPIKPHFDNKMNPDQIRKLADNLEEYTEQLKVFQEKMSDYRKHDMKLFEKFKQDVMEECGIVNHQNGTKLFNYVWNSTRNYSEVYDNLYELSEFLNCPYCHNKG